MAWLRGSSGDPHGGWVDLCRSGGHSCGRRYEPDMLLIRITFHGVDLDPRPPKTQDSLPPVARLLVASLDPHSAPDL